LAPSRKRSIPLTYSLPFAPAFFFGDGTVPPEELRPRTRPTSVCHALRSLSGEALAAIARGAFNVKPDCLDTETLRSWRKLMAIPSTWIPQSGFSWHRPSEEVKIDPNWTMMVKSEKGNAADAAHFQK